jgi:transcriptional regulator with XRE-family HTH domain
MPEVIPHQVLDIADRLGRNEKVNRRTVETLLKWFDATKRGKIVVTEIREALLSAELETDPDFTQGGKGDYITFRLIGGGGKAASPTSGADSPKPTQAKPAVDEAADAESANGGEAKNKPASEKEEAIEAPSAIGAWLNRHRLERNFSVPELASKAGLSALAIYNIESGRSQNPQRTTVAKLEKALNRKLSSEAKQEAKDEATIEGVGEWFNFDPSSQADWPDAAGVYVLYDISDRPIYVGQGQKISSRLRDHHEKFWFRPPIVQNAAYVGIGNKGLREQIEKVLIKFLKSNAVLNQQNVDR